MSDTHISDRILQLRSDLNEHNRAYHAHNAPRITDAEYDALFKELLDLEKQHPEMADSNSPTARVGFMATSHFVKTKHETKMLSLDNVFSAEEVVDFCGALEELWVEPKIDGASLELTYRDGRLVQAVTRGDGTTGDDVTANARTIKTIPLELSDPSSLRVRGEVYMTHTAFAGLNAAVEAAGDEAYSNPRNAAAGSLKLKEAAEAAKRNLSFVAYGTPDTLIGLATHQGLTRRLSDLGFCTVLDLPVKETAADPAMAFFADVITIDRMISSMAAFIKKLDLDVDGLVFKVNSLEKQRELGDGTKAPKWACAYKFPAERKATVLLGITVQVGRTGKLTPVAELKPVELGGAVISRASLMNEDEVARVGCGIGDSVLIERSAAVIPRVCGVHEKRSVAVWTMPKACPCCGSNVVRQAGMVDYYCLNKDCEDQVFARLRHATSKASLDMDGCGEIMVRELIRKGVRTLSDLFALENTSFLKAAARKKFLESREKAKSAPLWRKIHALGIDGIGSSLSQDMAARWNSLAAMADDLDELRRVIGEVNYRNFTTYVQAFAGEIDRLDLLEFRFESDPAQLGALSGKSFVITGTLMSGTRDEVSRRIEAAGGTVKGSVSKAVTCLVAGSEAGRTKLDKAKQVGTTIITEEQLYGLMGSPMPAVAAGIDPDYEF